MKYQLLLALLFSTPLGTLSQEPTVNWDYKAVRVDENHFQFFIHASMQPGWDIYKANKRDKCILSPLITFDKTAGLKPIGEIDVIEGIECDTLFWTCRSVPKYKSTVTFVQVFEMPITNSKVVMGKIEYRAINRYAVEPTQTVQFHLWVGAEIRHPFIKRTWDWIKAPRFKAIK
jgi:hypothetical protein